MARNFASGDYSETTMAATSGSASGAIAFRMRTTQATSNVCMTGRHGSPSSQLGTLMLLNNVAGKISAYGKRSGSADSFLLASTTTVNDGNWHSVVFNWQEGAGTPVALAVDGSIEASANTSATSAWYHNSTALRIGRDPNDGFWGLYVGEIADFTWLNAKLDAAEIVAFHKGFSPKRIKPRNLELYMPLVRNIQDIRGAAMTTSGTTVSDHPRVF